MKILISELRFEDDDDEWETTELGSQSFSETTQSRCEGDDCLIHGW